MNSAERPRLFTTRSRTDSSPAGHNERYYAFLDRVDRPWFEAVRQQLELWLDDAPLPFAEHVARTIRSTRDRQFYGAFFELYQFTLWTRMGFSTSPDPPIADTGRLGDFLVTGRGETFLVEATVSFDEATDSAESRRLGDAYDQLDRTNSPNFFLWITIEQGPGAMPSLAPVRRRLEIWLATLDPDQIALLALRDRRDLPSRAFEAGSWRLRFEAIPKSREARGRPGIRPLGVFDTGGVRVLNTIDRLSSALAAKADQSRGAGSPVVIALDALGHFVDEDDIYSSLYGDEPAQFRRRAPADLDGDTPRERTGFWTERRLGRRGHVSAVLTTENLGPWNVARVNPVIWMNPWATRPLVLDLPIRRVEIDLALGERVDHPATMSAPQILNVPNDWPGPGNAWDDP